MEKPVGRGVVAGFELVTSEVKERREAGVYAETVIGRGGDPWRRRGW